MDEKINRRRMRWLVVILTVWAPAHAQWKVWQAPRIADLRGIHSLGGGVAWASGTAGTVLHTVDDGQTWQICNVPPDGEKLDFRGVQAFDRNTAVVMSSGGGDLSRVYKTTDACRTWKPVLANPDKTGFWDAVQFRGPKFGILIGDPVAGHFPVFFTTDAGTTWERFDSKPIPTAGKNQSIFAASNTSLLMDPRNTLFYFVTGGGATSMATVDLHSCTDCQTISYSQPDMAVGESAGIFSVAARVDGSNLVIVAVGGDYKLPEKTAGTAAYRIDDRLHNGKWNAPASPPHGYRSAVAYDPAAKTWITVGPNGTDISTDDGRSWRAVRPSAGDTADADKNWNALSIPFVVGPHGRIGKLSGAALRGIHD